MQLIYVARIKSPDFKPLWHMQFEVVVHKVTATQDVNCRSQLPVRGTSNVNWTSELHNRDMSDLQTCGFSQLALFFITIAMIKRYINQMNSTCHYRFFLV